jgi:hypothetical protein
VFPLIWQATLRSLRKEGLMDKDQNEYGGEIPHDPCD